jgi:hypothetical protein
MNEFSYLIVFLALWIVLNRWVLPWFGIRTCMSGGCVADYGSCCTPDARTPTDKEAIEAKGNQS